MTTETATTRPTPDEGALSLPAPLPEGAAGGAGQPSTVPPEETQGEVEAGAKAEPKPEAKVPLTHEAWLAMLEAEPELKEAHERAERSRSKEQRKAHWAEFQSSVQETVAQRAQSAANLLQEFDGLNRAVKQAIVEGNVGGADFDPLLNRLERLWAQDYYGSGLQYALEQILGRLTEDPSLGVLAFGKLQALRAKASRGDPDTADKLTEYVAEIKDRLADGLIGDAYIKRSEHEKLLKRALEDKEKALRNQFQAQARQGQGPDQTRREPSGTSPTTEAENDAMYNSGAISHEQYKSNRERFGLSKQPGGRD